MHATTLIQLLIVASKVATATEDGRGKRDLTTCRCLLDEAFLLFVRKPLLEHITSIQQLACTITGGTKSSQGLCIPKEDNHSPFGIQNVFNQLGNLLVEVG